MECSNCPYGHRIELIEADIARNNDVHKEFYARFNDIDTNRAVVDVKYDAIMRTLEELKITVGELVAKPRKRWEAVIGSALGAIVAAVVGLLIGRGI